MYDNSDEEIGARLDDVLCKMDIIFKAVTYQGVLMAIFVASKVFG